MDTKVVALICVNIIIYCRKNLNIRSINSKRDMYINII